MKAYFLQHPVYKERFSDVWLWSEWAKEWPDTRVSKPEVDSFIAALARDLFIARILVNIRSWGPDLGRAQALSPAPRDGTGEDTT